jgi:hypothetical protein
MFGWLLGHSVAALILDALTIRSCAQAMRMHLPRIPLVTRILLTLHGSIATLSAIICWLLSANSPKPTNSLILGLIASAIIFGLSLFFAERWFQQDTGTKHIHLLDRLRRFRKANDSVDCTWKRHLLSSVIETEFGVGKNRSQKEIRTAVEKKMREMYAGVEHATPADIPFRACTLEEVVVRFRPSVLESRDSPTPCRIEVRTNTHPNLKWRSYQNHNRLSCKALAMLATRYFRLECV